MASRSNISSIFSIQTEDLDASQQQTDDRKHYHEFQNAKKKTHIAGSDLKRIASVSDRAQLMLIVPK